MGIAVNWNISRKIIYPEPDSNEIRMRVERYGKLYSERIMYTNSRDAQINQVNLGAKQLRQVDRPVLCIRVWGTNSKGFGGSNCNIGDLSIRCSVYPLQAAGMG